MSDEISEERYEIPEPASVSINGIRYEAMLWGKVRGLGQNGGFIVAIDEKTNSEVWLLKIYENIYDPELEKDVQDVYITRIESEPQGLIVSNERGKKFAVDWDGKNIAPLN